MLNLKEMALAVTKYQASFFIGSSEQDFVFSDEVAFVIDNFMSRGEALFSTPLLTISAKSLEEEYAFNDDEGTNLFHVDAFFDLPHNLEETADIEMEFGTPATKYFSLTCGDLIFNCGSVDELDEDE